MKSSVCAIVLSFNRPRMLVEALATVRGADEIRILDDGSSFDVVGVAGRALHGCGIPWSVKISPPISPEARLVTPRLGRAINEAVCETHCDVVTYLCDDDLFSPDWLPAVREWADKYPDEHWARGKWFLFADGSPPTTDRLCWLSPHWLTTGNFAHRRSCAMECDVKWREDSVAVHDYYLVLHELPKAHALDSVRALDVVAGWRREHSRVLSNVATPEGYTCTAEDLLVRE